MAAVLSNLLALASIWHLVALAGASGLQDVRQARCLAFCALGPLRRHPAVFCISYSPALVSPGRAALAGAAPHTTKQSSILGGGRRHPVCSMLRARKRGPAGGKHAALLDAVSQGNFSAVQQALVAGGSTEAVDDWGTSCLHTAVKGGHTEVVRLLLEAGANPDCASVSDDETSPLHLSTQKGMADITSLLLGSGATATKVDEFGDMPIDIAKRANNKALIQLLKSKSFVATVVDDGRGVDEPAQTRGISDARGGGASAAYRDKSYTQYGGEQMGSAESRKLVEEVTDWDALELGREGEGGSVVEMVVDPLTGEQYLRRVPLKKGARNLFPDMPPPQDDAPIQ